jgi:hypothetical protein
MCQGPICSVQMVRTIGLDIAKSVFQVHGVDAAGNVLIRRQIKRRYVLAFFQKLPPCVVGIEACATSHHWSRQLQAIGHTVRLMPPAYVKPYVERQKNDAADAEAICEAVTRPSMPFVATKTPEQQSCLMFQARHEAARLGCFSLTGIDAVPPRENQSNDAGLAALAGFLGGNTIIAAVNVSCGSSLEATGWPARPAVLGSGGECRTSATVSSRAEFLYKLAISGRTCERV